MKKRYCTSCLRFSIPIDVDDKVITIDFKHKDVLKKERYFDTEDNKIQTALENAQGFNKYFYKSTEFDWTREQNPVMSFPNNAGAKEWINKHHGVIYAKIVNREQLTYEYDKIGYKLEIESLKN